MLSPHQVIVDTLYNLRVGCVGSGKERHERPHKPLMLLTALEMIDDGHATTEHIPWSKEFCDRFTRAFNIVKGANDRNTPELPFFHLRSDKIWIPIAANSQAALAAPPKKSQFGSTYAGFSTAFADATDTAVKRRTIRELLVSRYFPNHYAALTENIIIPLLESAEGSLDEIIKPARCSAFAKRVTELYDSRCSACGLRIKLPNFDTSFVDAAHLIPFADSHDDHPSNGMALCKHHHWAMDRHLISPGPDGRWHVSNAFDKRRSAAEKELTLLHGEEIILPNDAAFYPKEDALKWRLNRLLNK